MTTLSNLNIATRDVKAYCVNFSIKKKLGYSSIFQGKFLLRALNAVHSVVANDDIYVEYTDSIGAYKVFYGKVRSIEPNGQYCTIVATHMFSNLYDWATDTDFTSSSPTDGIATELINSVHGPSLTVTETVTTPTTLSRWNSVGSTSIDQLRKLQWFSADGATDKLMVFYPDETDQDNVILTDIGATVPSTDLTISHANGGLIGVVKNTDTQENIINKVVLSHAGGRHISTTTSYDCSASITKYKARTATLYRKEIYTDADAIYAEDTLRRYYDEAKDIIELKARHSYLHGNSTHYPVLNTLYTVVDSTTGTTYTDFPCTEHTLNWPSFIDTIKLGAILPDFATYLGNTKSVTERSGQDSAGLNVAFAAYKPTAVQPIPDGITTKVTLSAETYDIGSNFNSTGSGTGSYSFVAPINGIYKFEAAARFAAMGTTATCYLYITKTTVGPTTGAIADCSMVGVNIPQLYVSKTVSLLKGDLIFLEVGHNYGSNINLRYGETITYLSGSLISSY